MIQLSKFSADDGPEFHSHAIVKADDFQSQTIGSTDKSTFVQRKHVERNRQLVAGYQAASLHDDLRRSARLSPTVPDRAAGLTKDKQKPGYLRHREGNTQVPSRGPEGRLTPSPRPTFSEPSHRYNPYS